MRPSKKEHLVKTAANLFNRNGFHATGIDMILSEAGVAKMTLYNNFPSKDALIVAALDRRNADHLKWLRETVEAKAVTPAGRLLALFDALDDWFSNEDFHGCPFLKASGEYEDRNDPVHKAALNHKGQLLSFIRELADQATAPDPVKLAGEIYLLMEGATTVAQLTGDLSTARRAKAAAENLIGAAFE